MAAAIAEEIYKHAIANNFKILVFCISSKKRAVQTAEMVKVCLDNKPIKFRVISEVDENLREIDQGRFVLPESYEAGDTFLGLKIAGKIFTAETFNPDDPSKDNLDYHYGDPLLQEDGTFKYPELSKYFSEPGESYKEVLLRFYSQVVKLSENMERFGDRVEPVIFTHGQPHQIFKNLSEVAEKINRDGYEFETGSLPRICWDLYQARKQGVVPFGKIDFVSIENLCKPHIVDLLQQEIEYLKRN